MATQVGDRVWVEWEDSFGEVVAIPNAYESILVLLESDGETVDCHPKQVVRVEG